jgi:hypothetical protein
MIRGIYPRGGPRADAPPSERVVYESLRETLGSVEGWVAYHSFRIKDPRQGEREADFLVVHPEHGGLVVEVKSGRIAMIDGELRQNGHPLHKDPRRQTRGFINELLSRAAQDGVWLPWITPAYAFPDTAFTHGPTADDLAEVVFGQLDLDDLAARIADHVRARRVKSRNFSRNWLEWLHALWGESWIPSLDFGARALAEARGRVLLDARQAQLLELIELNDRVLIEGVAGTGKSVIAAEAARRRARLGQRTLLVCFTRALAKHLTTALADTTVDVVAVRELDEAPPSYDAIIVDEAQDLAPSDWDLVEALSRGARLWAFADPDQGIWPDRPLRRETFTTFARLGRPYRCPEAISELAFSCLAEEPCDWLDVALEERRLVYLPVVSPKRASSVIREDLKTLLRREGVQPTDVAILSLRGVDHARTLRDEPAPRGVTMLAADDDDALEHLIGETFMRFKGLERPIVYVTDLEEVEDQLPRRLYIAISRALVEVRIVAAPETLAAIPALSPLLCDEASSSGTSLEMIAMGEAGAREPGATVGETPTG